MPDLDSVIIRRLEQSRVWLQTAVMETATSVRLEDAVIAGVPVLYSAEANLPAGATVLVGKLSAGVIVLGRIDGAYVPPTPPTPPDESWKPLTLMNGWVPYGGGFPNAEVRKVGANVEMRGLVAGGNATAGVPIGVTPIGYRPTVTYIGSTLSDNHAARIDIVPDGLVTAQPGCVSLWVWLGAHWTTF